MKHFIFCLTCFFLILPNYSNQAQTSITGNLSANPAHFLGWDNTTTFPLNIRHDRNNQPIQLWTGGLLRMRINDESNVQTINGFAGINTRGFVGLSPFNSFWNDPTGPYSLLHLAGDIGTQELSYRPWMGVGVTITGNGDGMYFGQRAMHTTLTINRLA